MIELNALDTAGLRTILYRTTANATAATVPTAYSAVDMPASRAARRRRTELVKRAAARRRKVMARGFRGLLQAGSYATQLWTALDHVDARCSARPFNGRSMTPTGSHGRGSCHSRCAGQHCADTRDPHGERWLRSVTNPIVAARQLHDLSEMQRAPGRALRVL
jgi:hypothetical protein